MLGVIALPQRALAQRSYRVYDTFTDDAERYLQNHQPDVSPNRGANWRWLNGEGRTLVIGGIPRNYGGTTREAWTYDSEMRDAIVGVDFTSASGSPHGGLIFRNAGPNEYFMLDANGPTLYRNDNGYLQYLGSGGQAIRAGERHRVEVHFIGATIDVYMDAAFQFQVSDWTYYDAGVSHGFYFDAPNDPNATFDNFEISYTYTRPVCTYAVSPLGRNMSADHASGSVTVSTQPGCVWNAWSEADFIYVVDSGGSGSGTVRYSVENSTRPEPRSGTFTVADSTITITQAALAAPPPSSSPSESPSAAAADPPTPSSLGRVVWFGNVPDQSNVNQCLGNCGAGCSGRPNPCGGPAYWSNEWLSAPQYVDDDFPISTCLGPVVVTDVYRHYVASGRWTYHGRSSDGCRAHDKICRALGDNLLGFLGCFFGAVIPGSAYCSGARDENWSYTYVLNGRSADPIGTYVMAQQCDSGF